MSIWLVLLHICTVLLATAQAQSTGTDIAAEWIPTDLNFGLISNLRNSDLSTPQEAIAGYSTLGIINITYVAQWIKAFTENPNLREATVRWVPSTNTRCAYGNPGCTRSVRVTILEMNFNKTDATDCQAYALLAADANLPRYSVLTNGQNTFLPSGPVRYEVIKAPNSTANSCTYVVQYPQATQTLANQLCSGGSCYNSTCVPCNVNQTLTSDVIATNCTPTSGLSPMLVAAIQGAGNCLADGDMGSFTCQISPGLNTSTCLQMSCFPASSRKPMNSLDNDELSAGDALVKVEGKGERRMQDLKIGDRVLVGQADGSLVYDDIYFFGHRDAQAWGNFVELLLDPLAGGGARRSLQLSPKHFLPASRTSPRWRDAELWRAEAVLPGDTVWAEGASRLEPYRVLGSRSVTKHGFWAPYTASGSIVVNGVAASVHSDWYLDSLLDAFGRPDLLPGIYQALLLPVRLFYKAVGPRMMQNLDSRFDFGELIVNPLPLLTTCATFVAISLGGFQSIKALFFFRTARLRSRD